MKLIENWRQAYRWFSVQAMGVSASVALAWAAIPQDLRDRLPDTLVAWIVFPTLAAGILGRMIPQKKKGDGDDQQP